MVAVSRSTDGGRNWSVPVSTGAPIDRPYFRVDQKTGNLWENSGFGDRVLTYSRDKGDTWVQVNHPVTAGLGTLPPPLTGAVYAPGAAPFPGSHFAVYDNILATVRAATGATANQPAKPAQFCRLNLALDDTATFRCTDIRGTLGMTGDFISADPTKTGRFAVLLKTGTAFKVFVTESAGATWSAPTTVNAPHSGDDSASRLPFTSALDKPWFDYSLSRTGPRGLLGIMWKSATPQGKIDVYSAVSTDNGATFSQPMRVNTVSFPPEPAEDGPGDDLSFLAFGAGRNGKPNAYIGWGDTRNGHVEGWFGRVPVAAYSW
jgi:hypothetical protein